MDFISKYYKSENKSNITSINKGLNKGDNNKNNSQKINSPSSPNDYQKKELDSENEKKKNTNEKKANNNNQDIFVDNKNINNELISENEKNQKMFLT